MTGPAKDHPADLDVLRSSFDAQLASLQQASTTFRRLLPHPDSAALLGHPGEDGRWTESLLAEFLRANLPSTLEVSTGFVVDTRNAKRSYQVDILIHDPTLFPPLFRYGDAVIVAPDGVLAAISVKFTLRPSLVEHEISELARIGRLCDARGREGPYLALIGYVAPFRDVTAKDKRSSTELYRAYARSIGRAYRKAYTDPVFARPGISANELVSSVLTVDGFLLKARAFTKQAAHSPGAPRRKVDLMWTGTGQDRYQLAAEMLVGVTRRLHKRRGFQSSILPQVPSAGMSALGSVPIVCEDRDFPFGSSAALGKYERKHLPALRARFARSLRGAIGAAQPGSDRLPVRKRG